ncbi:MAG: hypothetical protein VYE40_05205 [Myxococcota bacterium]|jgi:hypothetical protein|nr:hypothetical protein [Myxococcota bacterium]
MEVKPQPRGERLIESTSALMIPALLLLWYAIEKQQTISWEQPLATLGANTFSIFRQFADVVRWPIDKGWAWSASVIGIATIFRILGHGRETLLLLGTQGAALLAFAVLGPITKSYPPRLEILIYTSFGLTILVLAGRFLPKLLARPLGGILIILWLVSCVTIWSAGHSPTSIMLSALLGISSVVTLTVGMR